MEDQSIFNPTNTNTDSSILSGQAGTADQDYVNECIREVCLNGDSLSKYQKMIEKKFSSDFYQKCDNFVEEVRRSVERGKFSKTSVTNIKYLANEIHVPVETVDSVISHYTKQFADEERRRAEDEQKKADEQRRKEEENRIHQQQLATQAKKEQNRKQAAKNTKGLFLGLFRFLFFLLRLAIGIPLLLLFAFTWIPVKLAKPENQYKVEKALNNIWNFIKNSKSQSSNQPNS